MCVTQVASSMHVTYRPTENSGINRQKKQDNQRKLRRTDDIKKMWLLTSQVAVVMLVDRHKFLQADISNIKAHHMS